MSRLGSPRASAGVLLAHPGTQHSYETALGLQEAGLLHAYLTGFYYRPAGIVARGVRLLGNGGSARLATELYRRYKPGLAEANVRTAPALELLYVASTRLRHFRRFSEPLLRWRNAQFDRRVARRLERERPAAVVCYDSCAQQTFERARSLGITRVLDQSVGHLQTAAQLYREEAELHPDFADSLPLRISEELLERCTQEALLADCILSPSDYVRETLLANGVEASRIAAVPYGVDPEQFQPAASHTGRIFRVLFVGQLSQRKGIKYLLEAFKKLRLPSAELLLVGGVVGSGSGLRAYQDVFQHVPSVPHSAVCRIFREADLFVFPSLHEGSALVIYEALASGLPVITTPNSGSVVRDGVEGYLVPIRDAAALEEKILLLYEDKQLRQEMSRRARLRAEEFTWAAYRERLAGVFRGLLQTAG